MKKLNSFLVRNQNLLIFIFVVLCVSFISTDMFARMGGAGGGGGGGSSSGGGDGIGALIFYLIMMLPFPVNLIVIAAIIIGIIIFSRKKKQGSILNKIPANTIPKKKDVKGLAAYKIAHPDFKEEEFISKVSKAFTDIQAAWSEMNISKVRRFISDGMYQRVNTQFKMMNILKQRNLLEKLEIKGIIIDKIETDGIFDVMHVAVYASIKDKFVSETYPNLNTASFEEFVEYWSFIRKNSAVSKDMYHTYNCPNCGGDLSANMGDLSKCPYCGTITNSGEYDWVLAEITQADDYVTTSHLHDMSNTLANKIEEISDADPNFAVQIIEDKASNGYLQIETARVLKDPKLMIRFVTNEFYNKFEVEIGSSSHFVYNRIFLNDVTLIGALQKDNKNILALAVKSSYQRVVINNGKAQLLDAAVYSKNEVVFMSKDISSGENKGSVYAHQCPSCGGTISDTTDLNCPYCGNQINSTKNEWIISDIMSQNDYLEYFKANANLFIANVNPKKLDSMYKVRDYAFNNILIMIAADGVFDAEEIDFAKKTAKKWGYAPSKIEGMLDMAVNKQLVLRMPEDRKDCEKIYKLMAKTAAIDGNVSPEEQALLDSVRQQYLN
ncbi:MAG: TIM44-like domain-containing protein [Bacteroidales bacterium]|nr:TIM44-like domain-containing protein [Bacteroidales bacterium]